MSQEQVKHIEQQVEGTGEEVQASSVEEQSVATSTVPGEQKAGDAAAPTAPRKKRVKKAQPVNEEEISPRHSFWPLVLAFSLAVVLLGAVTNFIILGIGAVLMLAAIIGWITERR